MNINPSNTTTPPGDFELLPQFSVEAMQVFIPFVSGSLNVVQHRGSLSTGGLINPDSETRLSKSVFSSMIEQAQLDVKRLPGKANPLANLALAHLAGGDRAQAAIVFEQVLAINPRNYVALANLVKIRIQEGNLGRAEEICKLGLATYPTDPALFVSLSVLEVNRGNPDAALQIL